MFILGVVSFYVTKGRKRKVSNHYCLKCNDFTDDYYLERHVNVIHINDNTVPLDIKDALRKLGQICITNHQEDNVMMKCFERSYKIYAMTNAELFKEKLINDVTKDIKLVNEFKKLLMKFVLLSGYTYDQNMFVMMSVINELSAEDVVNYYVYILTHINS